MNKKQISKVVTARKHGISIANIAKTLGVTEYAVKKCIKDNNIPVNVVAKKVLKSSDKCKCNKCSCKTQKKGTK